MSPTTLARLGASDMAEPLSCPPRIAVLLAVHNGVAWLPEQLESILGQTGVTVSVFCSVDMSSDGSEHWLDEMALADARLTVLPHGQRFGDAASNFFRLLQGVDVSAFDGVAFADQDDIWRAGKLLRAHQAMRCSGAEGYSSNVVAFWPDGREALIEKSQPQARWDFLFEAAGPGCTYVMSRRLASALQDLIEQRGHQILRVGLHDWFVYAFARAHGYPWLIDDHAGMRYRQHDRNQVGVNTGLPAFTHRARVVLSGWGLAQSALIADLVGLSDDPFVKRWAGGSRWGLLWLATRARQCRRRGRDKLLFALSCLLMAVRGS
jgi:rhamnosyltransferase